MKLDQFGQNVLNILFPPVCLACKKRLETTEEKSTFICRLCRRQIRVNNGFYCPACGGRLYQAEKTCHSRAEFILAAVTSYEIKPVRELIQTLKYGGLTPSLKPWPGLIKEYLEKLPTFNMDPKNTVLVPIPIYKNKERQRGFNQGRLIAEVIATILAGKFERPQPLSIGNDCLVKIKPTASQTDCKDYKARTKNIAGSFGLKNPGSLKGKDVFLVDDVFTSGATMNEAARLLKEAGAHKIIGFVLTKA